MSLPERAKTQVCGARGSGRSSGHVGRLWNSCCSGHAEDEASHLLGGLARPDYDQIAKGDVDLQRLAAFMLVASGLGRARAGALPRVRLGSMPNANEAQWSRLKLDTSDRQLQPSTQ